MPGQPEQIILLGTKTMEQGGAAVGTSLGIYQLIVEHKDLILTLCTMGSFTIAIIGYITSSILNWYFKNKHYNLALNQQRRKKD